MKNILYNLYVALMLYSLYVLKPGRLMSAPIGDSAIGKVHFLTSYV